MPPRRVVSAESMSPGKTKQPGSGKGVKFVESDASGLPLKRKQVQHACQPCREKKKRCIHSVSLGTQDAENAPTPRRPVTLVSGSSSQGRQPMLMADDGALTPPAHLGRTAVAAPAAPSAPSTRGRSRHTRRVSGDRSSRFVGDTDPTGMFIEATASDTTPGDPHTAAVGIWATSANGPSEVAVSRPPTIFDRLLLPMVRETYLARLPPEDDFSRLKIVYLSKIYPIFPIIPEVALQGEANTEASIVLRQSVCLAAATDPEMAQHLRLADEGSDVLPYREFSQHLSDAIRAVLETSLIADRVVHIRVLALLSLYFQPSNAGEADLPPFFCSQAIHHVQTLGLHLFKDDSGQQGSEDFQTVFCAVWALDRLNAAAYGRPRLIHERDVGADLEDHIHRQRPCFRLFLSIVQWLSQIIELYRPMPSGEVKDCETFPSIDLPVLEEMIEKAGALNVPSPLVATLEALYHAVIILSCRLPRPVANPVSSAAVLPPPSANARRSLAAERIAAAVRRDNLSPMPFVPYAVSLALSVEYRKMRHSKLPMFRARARDAFRSHCELLSRFGDVFWSARVTADLGGRVLKEMERAANSLRKEAMPTRAKTGTQATSHPPVTESQSNGHPQVPLAQMVVNDDSLGLGFLHMPTFDELPDLFPSFDPNFDLDAVDDALYSNLDVSHPMNWSQLGQAGGAVQSAAGPDFAQSNGAPP